MFAGEIRILDLLMGNLNVATQSDLFQTIRNKEISGAKTLSADFETNLKDISILQNTFVTNKNSRYLRELANVDLKIYFHVSQYDFKSLEGTIFGYVGPKIQEFNNEGIRLRNRRILISPNIDSELVKDLRLENIHDEYYSVSRPDLEATYELLEENKLILLRYLNFITFTDLNYSVPTGYRFFIVVSDRNKTNDKISLDLEIPIDSDSIAESGGICIIPFPKDLKIINGIAVQIICTKDNGIQKILMKESKLDLFCNSEPNYLVLSSGEKKQLIFKVTKNNITLDDLSELEFNHGEYKHSFSPPVAYTRKGHLERGSYILNIEARNLENSDIVDDPIYGAADSESDEARVKISGELPWDRYYGNCIFVKLRGNGVSIQQNIPVRVIHSIPLDDLNEDVMDLNKEKIQEVITKLMSYYTRYYPWLHVRYRYRYNKTDRGLKKSYEQFLKIKEFLNVIDGDHLDHLHTVHESISNINHLLERLQLPDDDWKKMPRSRDFPRNGVEFLNLWKGVMVDKLVAKLKQQKKEILESENSKNLGVENDISDYGVLQKIVEEIDFALENVPDGYKKLFLIWKLQLLDHIIKEITVLKTQTKHAHTH